MADTYSLGSIPPLSAWEGETLTFKVTSTLGERTRFVKRAIPSPKGRTFIDEKTGSCSRTIKFFPEGEVEGESDFRHYVMLFFTNVKTLVAKLG